ncbi:MAG TPA: MBL fold metallo-hydrolase [Phycisphaerae bacterium]|nr:MBL fold metallo-hydrolase [Phycisphaerae bacterium]
MATDSADAPKIVTVGEGFHVRQEVDNIAWIDLGEYAIVVDALERAELEDEVFQSIRSTLGDRPVRYVLNTHTHYDHTALNAAFQRRCGSEVINRRTGRIPPDGRWFEGKRRKVLMLPAPGCHTDEDCVVWVPDDRALFVGDIFGWGLIPLSRRLNADSAKLLVDTYTRLIEFDASVVIPGHGPLCTTAELKRWVAYFHWLAEQVRRACDAGKTDRQIADQAAPPDDMKTWWRFLQWKHDDSLGKVLQAVRRGWKGPAATPSR